MKLNLMFAAFAASYSLTLLALPPEGVFPVRPVRPPVVKPPVVTPVPTKIFRLSLHELAQMVDAKLNGLGLRMHNYQSQGSYVQWGTTKLSFEVPRHRVDIDCGTLCPDLGDGYFYLNDVNLSDAQLSWGNSSFLLRLAFEDSGREIKGIHSVLGDNGMPDFNMSNMVLSVNASPRLSSRGKLMLSFYNSKLQAGIQSTGGCGIGGVDICNAIFGTDRKIQKGVETASVNALNGSLIQAALTLALTQYLDSKGIQGTIRTLSVQSGDLVIGL
jgi:hypothetical protein